MIYWESMDIHKSMKMMRSMNFSLIKKIMMDMMMMMMWCWRRRRQFWFKRFWTHFICKTSMCNQIDLNIFFPYVVALQWTIVNTFGTFIIMLLNRIGVTLLWFYCIYRLDRYWIKKHHGKFIILYRRKYRWNVKYQ